MRNVERRDDQLGVVCPIDEQDEKYQIKSKLSDLEIRVRYLETQIETLRRETNDRHRIVA